MQGRSAGEHCAAPTLDARGARPFYAKRSLEVGTEATTATAVASARAGRADGLRALYTRYSDNVYGYVLSIVGDSHEAEDVTQQVFSKLPAALARYEPRGTLPFSAWILRVARNAALDNRRRLRAVPCEQVWGPDTRHDETGYERRVALREALVRVPVDQREVLLLRHLVGLSPGEIADRLGKSESAVHGLHHRGRRTLRHELIALDSAPAAREAA